MLWADGEDTFFPGEEPSFWRKKVLPPDPFFQESRLFLRNLKADLLPVEAANPLFLLRFAQFFSRFRPRGGKEKVPAPVGFINEVLQRLAGVMLKIAVYGRLQPVIDEFLQGRCSK